MEVKKLKHKKRLSYITVVSVFGLTTIFVGVHAAGTKDSFAHSQFVTSQQRSSKYSQTVIGRDPRKIFLVMQFLNGRGGTDDQKQFRFDIVRKDSGILSSVSPRGPPPLDQWCLISALYRG